MPVYEYRCPKCRTEFEVMRPMSEMDRPALCPKCGTEGERLVSGFASKVGFYVRAPAKPPFRADSADSDKEAESKEDSQK